MPFEIVRNDIVNMQVDAIVNTANPESIIGDGVDNQIHLAAGPQLLAARKRIGDIDFGDAAVTPAFCLPSKIVIHTVSPFLYNQPDSAEKLLRSCYKRSLTLAKENKCESIAFPLLGAGNCGFSNATALKIATSEITSFLFENDMMVYLCVFNRDAFALSEKLFASVKSYIDENYVEEKIQSAFYHSAIGDIGRRSTPPNMPSARAMSIEAQEEADTKRMRATSCPPIDDLGEKLKKLDAGFSETLLRLIDLTGKKDSEIYKKANVDRKLFSKIRNNPQYKPSKSTALAFAVALELDLTATKDLLQRAGYAISRSSKFDLIIEYFITNKIYNVFEINETLFAFDQPLIGG